MNNNPISVQEDILSSLCALLHNSAEKGYESASCRFTYLRGSDGSFSVENEFWFIKDNKEKFVFLERDPDIKPLDLVPQLFDAMREHTGGEWKSFVLTLDDKGRAGTKFEYD